MSFKNIKEKLGLDKPRATIVKKLETALNAAPRGLMFEYGGLCSGYPLRPMPDQYFVAQEFNTNREDLRSSLTSALEEFHVKPICADDFLWAGHILCKISALIQSTPFGVYQLTNTQNRNVYLELGIAIGLGRPFVLVKDQGADVSELTQGLEYYSITSYLEMRYEFPDVLRPFLTEIANYPVPSLRPAGSQNTVVIAHGNIDVIDFCLPVAKAIAAHNMTPIILNDPTGKLSRYLNLEGVAFHIIGSTGRTRLDETISAIQTAHLGIYRIDKASSPDTFLSLGMSIGLNRLGLLMHKNTAELPSDVKGLSSVTFNSYADLKRVLPEKMNHFMTTISR